MECKGPSPKVINYSWNRDACWCCLWFKSANTPGARQTSLSQNPITHFWQWYLGRGTCPFYFPCAQNTPRGIFFVRFKWHNIFERFYAVLREKKERIGSIDANYLREHCSPWKDGFVLQDCEVPKKGSRWEWQHWNTNGETWPPFGSSLWGSGPWGRAFSWYLQKQRWRKDRQWIRATLVPNLESVGSLIYPIS